MTLKEAFDWLQDELKQTYPEDRERRNIISYLLENHLEIHPFEITLSPGMEISPQNERKIKQSLSRLKASEPIQYVLGKAWFHDLELKVTPAVLIPRQETEELVELVLNKVSGDDVKALDIGTGSGCIALALKSQRPDWEVQGSEYAEKSLEVARENAKLNMLQADFFAWDLNDSFPRPKERYDLIVSNPPYVTHQEKDKLDSNVIDFEPDKALFPPSEDPLYYYRIIAEKSPELLNENGQVALEIHENQAKKVLRVFQGKGFKATVHEDLSGKKRFVFATLHS